MKIEAIGNRVVEDGVKSMKIENVEKPWKD